MRFYLWKRRPYLKKGLYHFRGAGALEGMRMHLRVEDDGSGVLVVNASRVLFLNQTATMHVYLFMHGVSEEAAAEKISSLYEIDRGRALEDHRKILYTVNTFAGTPDVCPVSYLGVEKIEPFKRGLSAPYRMDLAITYRCDNKCVHCYAGGPRETPELETADWRRVIDKIYEIGIPHIVFTGGEPTLRSDLPDLVMHAEARGLVTGLVTNGRRLKDASYLRQLIDAGLDHIQVTIESHDERIHDSITGVKGSWRETVEGLKNAITTPCYTITNTTINSLNAGSMKETVSFLHSLGLKEFACNGLIHAGKAPSVSGFWVAEGDLKGILAELKEHAASLGMDIVWYTPTQYCQFNPLELELGIKSCSACRISMCIEPDGGVIPCQSYFERLGHILDDDWAKIWNGKRCREIRERATIPEKCVGCPDLDLCGGGCPLNVEGNAAVCRERH
uniref:Radical SAM protein n=1 Tax=Candidatus Methanomethylicus mesodigestus TaxID=1867258 RepID=A0A7C3J4T2_9CREN